MVETIVLDPIAVASDAGRTQFDITSLIGESGPDWGDAEIQAYLADQNIGSSPVDYRVPNRQIKIPLVLKGLSYSTWRQNLQHKASLFQREGGWIMRKVDTTPYYADIQNATLHLGGGTLAAFRGLDIDAVLTLEALPDWYGDEITLDALTSPNNGAIVAKLQQSGADAVIKGNYPSRCRIKVTDTSNHDQKGLYWAYRARSYDSASSSALIIQAENMSPLNGASSGYLSGNSGDGSSLGMVWHGQLPTAAWTSMLYSTLGAASGGLAGNWAQNGVSDAGVGTIAWNFTNRFAHYLPGGTNSFANLLASQATQYLKTNNHNFNIPSNATISGIQLTIYRASNASRVTDTNIRLAKAGVVQATNKSAGASWASTDSQVPKYFGGPVDLWGTTWTPADINDVNFGAAISATCNSGGADVANVFDILITVAYTVPAQTPLTHRGTYRVWARCYAMQTAAKFRLMWGVGSLSVPVTNDPAVLPGYGVDASGYPKWYLLDLGTIRIDAPPIGASQWFGIVQAYLDNPDAQVVIDRLEFQSLDESSGRLGYAPVTTSPISVYVAPQDGTVAIDDANDSPPGTAIHQNPTLALHLTGGNSLVNVTGPGGSHWLKVTGFPFSIPLGATIKGIQVDRYGGNTQPSHMRLVKAGVTLPGAASQNVDVFVANGPYGSTQYIWGGNADLWGTTWVPSDINAANFGLSMGFYLASGSASPTTYCLRLSVWYQLASGVTILSDAVLYANGVMEIRTDGIVRDVSGNVGNFGSVSQQFGDMPRIPPSGMENRPVEIMVRTSQGDLSTLPDSPGAPNVQVKYRPCHLYIGT